MTIEQALQRAVEDHKAGKLQGAEALYRAILQAQPQHPDANHNLGVMAVSLNKTEAALPLFKIALEANPSQGQFWLSYVDALIKEKQFDNARSVLEQGKKQGLAGEKVELLEVQLATIFLTPSSQSLSESENLTITQQRKKISKKKDKKENSPKNLTNLNRARSPSQIELNSLLEYYQKGQQELGQKLAATLTQQYPNHPFGWKVLGAFFKQTGKLQDSVIANQKVLEISPNDAEAHSNLGITLQELGRLEEAETSYKKAIAIKPDFAEAHSNLGSILQELGRLEEAESSYKKAIAIKPDFAEAHYNLGITLQELGRLEEAETSIKKAIVIKPDYADAHSNLGNTLKELGRLEAAETSYKKAIAIKPNFVSALQNYSSLLAFKSNYNDLCKLSDEALNYAGMNLITKDELYKIWENRLFTWIYHPDLSAEAICAEHIRWGKNYAHFGQAGFANYDRTLKRRLRIGYVSPDFRGHTCRFYFEPLFSKHDHVNFEVFAYSSVLQEDEHTQRLKPYFDHWRNILGVSDEAAAEMIRKDKIDILIDCCGHMRSTRIRIFAHKPAPIQVTWLGSAWTTGLPQMDYVLFDPYMAPEGTATSEQIVRLPRTWAAFRPGERATQASVKASPALRNGYVTFGYSGRTERLNHLVFTTWGKILKRLPQARLILDFKAFNDPKTQAYYREFLEKHGIDTTRVVMRNSMNIFDGLGDIDILLDSFPHSGGTMLFDAIWMGVPAITLASPRPVGRIGTSLMTNLGLPEWVAQDKQEYEDKAISFAQDINALANLRSGMRARMQASPVMDEKAFAQDVENAFETMWRNWSDPSNQELLNSRTH